MHKETTADRLKQLMRERNLRQIDILRKCEPFCKQYNEPLNSNALSQYISGKYEPRQNKLAILGLALNVSEAWLMGYDVPMERNAPPPSVEDLSEEEAALIELLWRIPEDKRRLVIRMLRAAADDL